MNSNGQKTFYIESLGCVTNKVDTARVETFLKSNGWRQTQSCGDASLVILMTCAFSKASEDHNIERLQQLTQIKSPKSQMIIGGCLPSINAGRLRTVFDGFVFSPKTLDSLNGFISGDVRMESVSPIASEADDPTLKAIRISTGCMGNCSYCAIPFANGRTRSRSADDIMADIRSSVEQGFRRIKLISEDLGAYGQDRDTSIVELLSALISSDLEIELLLDNLNPNWLHRYKRELIDLFHSEKVVKKFSIPIQSGSDRILRSMRRGYAISHVRTILSDLLDVFPDTKICTDFMVGFPSETDADFEKTKLILNEFPFYFIEIFVYEDRPGTRASKISPKISEEVKEVRRQILFKDFLKQFLKANNIRNAHELEAAMIARKGLPVHFNLPSNEAI